MAELSLDEHSPRLELGGSHAREEETSASSSVSGDEEDTGRARGRSRRIRPVAIRVPPV